MIIRKISQNAQRPIEQRLITGESLNSHEHDLPPAGTWFIFMKHTEIETKTKLNAQEMNNKLIPMRE